MNQQSACSIAGLELPAARPYLNRKQRYPVGNGILFAVGDAAGAWLRVAGPGYTIGTIRDSVFTSETIAVEVDGAETPVTPDMHRAARTGVFYGVSGVGELRIALIDLARWGRPWIARLVAVENSGPTTHTIRIKARLKAACDVGAIPWHTLADASGTSCGYRGESMPPTRVVMALSDAAATAHGDFPNCDLHAGERTLAPGQHLLIAVCHYAIAPDADCAGVIACIRRIDYAQELRDCIREWTAWYDGVAPEYSLDRISDLRARDLVEGGLAVLKTNQSQDGGLIAHTTYYTQGYFRDAALGLRGFDATGHFEESKQWIAWTERKFQSFKHIPNWASCLSSLAERGLMQDLGNQDVESTALCVLAARDYCRATGDWQPVLAAQGHLRYCMDAQLRHAAANGYRMEFCGDETEVCGAVDFYASGMLHRFKKAAEHYWAMTSVALCAAALEFYIELLPRLGLEPAAYINSLDGARLDLREERRRLQEAMGRDYWRIDVPEHPDGFHDAFRAKADLAWPTLRIVNLTLFPVYFGTPYQRPERRALDVQAMFHHFDRKTGFLQLVPGADTGFDGHTLGYLLWTLLDVGHPAAEEVYRALVNGPTADCWGSFAEAYSRDGIPNDHDLRTFETGCNLSAIAKYWGLGKPASTRSAGRR